MGKKMKKNSICISAFNAERYVDRCFQSLLSLQSKPFEIIFIDDGSSDNTFKKAKKYSDIFPELYVYSLPHQGVGKARNTALQKSSGDYVWAIDCDDTIPSNALDIFLDALDKYDSDVIVGAVNLISQQGKIIRKFASDQEYYNIIPIEHPEISLYSSGFHVSMIIKKRILTDHNIIYGEDIVTSEDGVFLFSLVRKIKKMTIIQAPVYNYYIENPGSLSKCRSLEYYNDDLYAWSFLTQGTLTKTEEEYAAARTYYRIEEFFTQDIKIYLQNFSDANIKTVINCFIKHLAHTNICDKIITSFIENGYSYLKMAAFMICIKNSDLLSAFKIVKFEMAANKLEKKSLSAKIIKKFRRIFSR